MNPGGRPPGFFLLKRSTRTEAPAEPAPRTISAPTKKAAAVAGAAFP
jgi:hypothetical protein